MRNPYILVLTILWTVLLAVGLVFLLIGAARNAQSEVYMAADLLAVAVPCLIAGAVFLAGFLVSSAFIWERGRTSSSERTAVRGDVED